MGGVFDFKEILFRAGCVASSRRYRWDHLLAFTWTWLITRLGPKGRSLSCLVRRVVRNVVTDRTVPLVPPLCPGVLPLGAVGKDLKQVVEF